MDSNIAYETVVVMAENCCGMPVGQRRAKTMAILTKLLAGCWVLKNFCRLDVCEFGRYGAFFVPLNARQEKFMRTIRRKSCMEYWGRVPLHQIMRGMLFPRGMFRSAVFTQEL